MTPEDILHFWFSECTPDDWWRKSGSFDALIRRRFGGVHSAAAQGEFAHWRARGRGRLAEIIVLDQFSRNMYRDDPRAFATDALAVILAQEAIAQDVQAHWEPAWRSFLYMPFMHSESAKLHAQAVDLFDEPGLEDNLKFEMAHKAIIDRFGRYPHRNAILGRSSTPEELEFLEQPGSSF